MGIHERLPMNSCDKRQYSLVATELEKIKSEINDIGCNLIF